MKGPLEPPRLSADVPRASTLGRALEAARRRGPTDEQWRALERSVLTTIAPAAPPGASAPTSALRTAGAVKAIALVTLASLGTGAGVRWLLRSKAPVVETRIVTSVDVPSSVIALAPPIAEPRASAEDAPTPRRRSVSARRPTKTHAPDELELLARANRALATAPAVALSLTESHARLFPTGALEEEREVIAVSALARLGREEEARTRADRFMRAHAGSAYALRIERALAQRAPVDDEVR